MAKKMNEKELKEMISKEMKKAINAFLADGTIDMAIINKSPADLLEQMGHKLNNREKAILEKLTINELLDVVYTELGNVDMRFLQARPEISSQLGGFPLVAAKVAVPVIGVGVVMVVGGVAIKVAIDNVPDSIEIEDPNEDGKI